MPFDKVVSWTATVNINKMPQGIDLYLPFVEDGTDQEGTLTGTPPWRMD